MKNFTYHTAHRLHSRVEHFYLPKIVGGRGVTDMRRMHFYLVNGMREYFYTSMETNPFYSATVKNDKHHTVLNLRDRGQAGTDIAIGEMVQQYNNYIHGRHANNLNQDNINLI